MARPTKYNKNVLADAVDYLDNYTDYDHPFPSIVGFCRAKNYPYGTVQQWFSTNINTEFTVTLENIKSEQHMLLVHGGVTSRFNSNITKLMLHNFGYSDKTEVKSENTHTVELPPAKKMTLKELEAAIFEAGK